MMNNRMATMAAPSEQLLIKDVLDTPCKALNIKGE